MKELKAHRLQRQIDTLRNELEEHQSKCKHNNVVKKHGANNGNYDPSADRYWTDFHCQTCLKRWTEEGSK